MIFIVHHSCDRGILAFHENHHVRSLHLSFQLLKDENVMHSLDDVEIRSSIFYFLEFNLNDEFYKNGKIY
jgi:hypothetical protein